jgi:hypothetical protein
VRRGYGQRSGRDRARGRAAECAFGQAQFGFHRVAVRTAVAGDALPTIFKFSPLPENPRAASGSFSMIGTETGEKLDNWINQPDGYSMVDLEVIDPRQGGTLSGAVISGSCSDFLVHKTT